MRARGHCLLLAGVYALLQGGMYALDADRCRVDVLSGAPFAALGLGLAAYVFAAGLYRAFRLQFRNAVTTMLGGCVLLGWLVLGPARWGADGWGPTGYSMALGLRAVDSLLLAALAGWILFRRAAGGGELSGETARWKRGDAAALVLAAVILALAVPLASSGLGLYYRHQVVPFLAAGLKRETVEPELAEGSARALGKLAAEHPAALEALVDAIAGGSAAAIETLSATGRPVAEGRAELRSPALCAVIADNQAFGSDHKAGYSGVAELSPAGAASVFVPAYAGLNFEHIFSGDEATVGWDIFEPRRSPMALLELAPSSLQLRQERTEHWPLATTITYTLGGDAIDMTVLARLTEPVPRKHGYLGLFFASYIHAPEDMAIHFLGRSRPGTGDASSRWIRHVSPRHGEAACHRPAGSVWDPSYDHGFKIALAAGHSDLEHVYPFYYGVSHGKALIFLFERPQGAGEVRFAQSPSGGGEGNPAWDFLFLQRQWEVGVTYRFRARLVVRDFRTRDEVARIYEAWSGEKVEVE